MAEAHPSPQLQLSRRELLSLTSKASLRATLLTALIFMLVAAIDALTDAHAPVWGWSFAMVIGFVMVSFFWIPVWLAGTAISTIVLGYSGGRNLLLLQLAACAAVATIVTAVLTPGFKLQDFFIPLALSLVFGIASSLFIQRYIKTRPANG